MQDNFSSESNDESKSYLVLARKYRPRFFSQLVGQENLVRILQNGLSQGRLGHGFIFSGIRGTGKTTVARLLARCFNCDQPQTPEPCGICPSCESLLNDKNWDVLEIDAASHTGVDDMREVIESARYRPVYGRYKIFLIDEVHMLSKSAFNALLKTLEEPPDHVKFLFATTEIQKVPATILSRCLRFDLKRLDLKVLQAHLASICDQENIAYEPSALAIIARAGEGSVRDSLSLLEQAIVCALSGPKPWVIRGADVEHMLGIVGQSLLLDIFQSLLQGDTVSALKQVRFLYHQGSDPGFLLDELIRLTHLASVFKVSSQFPEDFTFSSEDQVFFKDLIKPHNLAVLGRLWQMLCKAQEEVRQSAFPLQALEMICIRLAYIANFPTPEQLLLGMKSTEQVISSQRPFETFEDCLKVVQSKREGLLYANLSCFVRLRDFRWGVISCALESGAPEDLIQTWQSFLQQETGFAWQIDISSEGGLPPRDQVLEQDLAQAREAITKHPLVEKAQNIFPGISIENLEIV